MAVEVQVPSGGLARFTLAKRARLTIKHLVERITGGGLGNVLARGAAGAFIVSIIGTGLMYVTEMLYTRLLGAAQYGHYAYAMTWASLLALICRAGTDTSIVRFGTADSSADRWGLFWGLYRWSHLVAGGAVAAAIVLLLPVVWLVRDTMERDTVWALYASAAVLPSATMIVLRGATLRALGYPTLSRTLLSLFRPVLLTAMVLGVYLFVSDEPQGYQATLGAAVAMTLVAVAGSVMVRRVTDPATRRVPGESQWREWLDLALPALFIASLDIILHYSDKVMLGIMVGTLETGIYVIVVKSSGLVAFGLLAVNTALVPMISRLWASGQLRELQRILTLGARAGLVLALPPVLIFLFFGDWLLAAFGPGFVPGFGALRISTMGQLVNAMAGTTAYLMMMTGHQKQLLSVFGGCAALNVGLNWLFIPVWGMEGAATATAGCLVLWNVLVLAYLIRKLRLDPSVVGLVRPTQLHNRPPEGDNDA